MTSTKPQNLENLVPRPLKSKDLLAFYKRNNRFGTYLKNYIIPSNIKAAIHDIITQLETDHNIQIDIQIDQIKNLANDSAYQGCHSKIVEVLKGRGITIPPYHDDDKNQYFVGTAITATNFNETTFQITNLATQLLFLLAIHKNIFSIEKAKDILFTMHCLSFADFTIEPLLVLEDRIQKIETDMKELKDQVSKTQDDMKELKDQASKTQEDMKKLASKTDMNELKNQVSKTQEDMQHFKDDIMNELKGQVSKTQEDMQKFFQEKFDDLTKVLLERTDNAAASKIVKDQSQKQKWLAMKLLSETLQLDEGTLDIETIRKQVQDNIQSAQ